MKQRMTFEQWMEQVNQQVEARCGMSASDLPDVCYCDWYEDGMSAAGAARRAIRSAKEEMAY